MDLLREGSGARGRRACYACVWPTPNQSILPGECTMSTPDRSILEIPSEYRSKEVASCLAQMDDQLRLLTEDTRDITPEELEWQPKPGMNTIGMLLAHNAIVEVFWTLIALKRDEKPMAEPVLGINM